MTTISVGSGAPLSAERGIELLVHDRCVDRCGATASASVFYCTTIHKRLSSATRA
jgi:hypothetical protein